jgi:hypothetical protein
VYRKSILTSLNTDETIHLKYSIQGEIHGENSATSRYTEKTSIYRGEDAYGD